MIELVTFMSFQSRHKYLSSNVIEINKLLGLFKIIELTRLIISFG